MKNRLLLLVLFLSVTFSGIMNAQNRSMPFSWDNATVYFMLNDRFNNGDPGNDYSYGRSKNSPNGELDFQGGDLKGITQKINAGYFDDLGVNAIWITAPYEQMHGSIGSENSWAFHGYWTKDWSQMDDNMGTEQDLRDFVDAAHDHGIRVVMDIVMNHPGYPTSWDDAWPDTWVRNDDCNNNDIYCPVGGLPDMRTDITSGDVDLPTWIINKWAADGVKDMELAELDAYFARTGYPRTPRYYLIKWLSDWVREFGIDGFRIDTAKHIEVEAWAELKEQCIQALREWKANNEAKKPDDLDFWMTGEVYGQSVYDGKNYYFDHGFDNVINFNFKYDLNDKSQEEIFSYYANQVNNTDGFNILSYIASHDVSPYDRSNLYYAGTTLMLAPGGVQIYYGDESGRPFFSPQTYGDAGYRSFMNWDEINNNTDVQNLLSHWQKLGRFRREHLSVGAGSHEKLSDSPYIFRRSYTKNGNDDKVLVAMNIPESASAYTLNVYNTFSDGTLLKDYFSGDMATVSGGQVTFNTSFGMVLAGKPYEVTDQVNLDIQPESGHYNNAITVSMSANTSVTGASTTIYYTLDGTEPGQNSNTYNSPFSLGGTSSETITVKAIAYDTEGNGSNVEIRTYSFGEKTGFDVHFKNTSNWSDVYIYLYNKTANTSIPGWTWPGVKMTQEDGTQWYVNTINEDVEVGIVFSDNAGNQTDDLSRSAEGWFNYSNNTWYDACPGDCPNTTALPVLSVNPTSTSFNPTIDVSLDATNNGIIYYTTDGTAANNNDTPYTGTLTFTSTTNLRAIAYNEDGESNTINETYTLNTTDSYDIHFKNTNNWNEVYIYLFNNATGSALPGWSWPGVSMSQEQGSDWYAYTIDEDVEVGIVINNNNNGSQTDDLTRTIDGWYDYSNGTWYNSCPGDCPGTEPDGLTVYYNNNNTNWATVSLYFWGVTPSGQSTAWPGVQMSDTDGDGWYSYTLEGADCANVIFSNNGASQTGDLNTCGNSSYYDNGWTSAPANLKSAYQNKSESEPGLLVVTKPYPNPFINQISFSISETHANIIITDTKGRVIYNRSQLSESGDFVIDLAVPSGLYFMQIVANNTVQNYSILKQ